MRYLAIGDIHGCYDSLAALVDYVPIAPGDMVVTLGDYVNRGPKTREVIDWLVARQATGFLKALRGNHEVMMLRAREDNESRRVFFQVGGKATCISYGKPHRPAKLEAIPAEHWSFLENTLPYFETETHIFVHANLYPEIPLEEQPELMLYWEKFEADWPQPAHCSGKTMVCGHTSQKSGKPLNVGHAVCLDTWAYGRGWLTCLDVATGIYWQANEQGETRTSVLKER